MRNVPLEGLRMVLYAAKGPAVTVALAGAAALLIWWLFGEAS